MFIRMYTLRYDQLVILTTFALALFELPSENQDHYFVFVFNFFAWILSLNIDAIF